MYVWILTPLLLSAVWISEHLKSSNHQYRELLHRDLDAREHAERISAKIHNIERLNLKLISTIKLCEATAVPSLKVSLIAQAQAIISAQELSLSEIRLFLSTHRKHAVLASTYREPVVSTCALPGPLRWKKQLHEPVTEAKSEQSGFCIFGEYLKRPYWKFCRNGESS